MESMSGRASKSRIKQFGLKINKRTNMKTMRMSNPTWIETQETFKTRNIKTSESRSVFVLYQPSRPITCSLIFIF